tara:strand:+ start:621 stop:1340 length:720 start_codon:yes stop_codon:yes gene_type:complete
MLKELSESTPVIYFTGPPWVAIQGVFFFMKKVTFLIDGFNLYHSILDLNRDCNVSVKWLNLSSFFSSYLYLFRPAKLSQIHYFSAFPYHKQKHDPDKIVRHKNYVKCLKSTGIIFVEGRFKRKPPLKCFNCKQSINLHEEKETDVSIAVTALELAMNGSADIIVFVTGDTDLVPAVKKCNQLFPAIETCIIFPYKRRNKELLKIASKSFNIGKDQYLKHQFPNPVILEDGSEICKPISW